MMLAPELWVNGRQITGLRTDRAPVLARPVLTWGSDSPVDQPAPSNLSFEIMFLDGMDDVPDLKKGALIELINPSDRVSIFTGNLRTAAAAPGSKKGSLTVRANATDSRADLANKYISTDWPGWSVRRGQLLEAFADAGYALELPHTGQSSEPAVYNSIKLLTMLERHISRYRGRHHDTSYRRSNGTLVRRITVTPGTSRAIPGDRLVVTVNGEWDRTYGVPTVAGVPSPLLDLPASNVLLDPSWTQDPADTITAVQMSFMLQGDDGYTTTDERTYSASAAIRNEFGTQSTDVETDLMYASDRAETAAAFMNDDAPWKMSALTIHDSDLLGPSMLNQLLNPSTRHKLLVAVSGIISNRPDRGTTVLRSYVLGGAYSWTGTTWEITLSLERTIYARPTLQATYNDIGMAADSRISQAALSDIGRQLTFADFREIESPR